MFLHNRLLCDCQFYKYAQGQKYNVIHLWTIDDVDMNGLLQQFVTSYQTFHQNVCGIHYS